MSRAMVLAAGRRAAEAGMVDACIIRRTTAVATNRLTGHTTPTRETVYTGPCRVQEIFGFSRDTQPTPDQDTLARYRVLQLPVATSTGIRVSDEVEITACVHDADLVGVTMVVRDQSAKTEATARRIGVEELTG